MFRVKAVNAAGYSGSTAESEACIVQASIGEYCWCCCQAKKTLEGIKTEQGMKLCRIVPNIRWCFFFLEIHLKKWARLIFRV